MEIKNLFKILAVLLLIPQASFANENLTLKWNSKEGLTRLNNTEYKNDFYQMAENFQPQINPLYCGIATSVIILNTIYEGEKIPSQSAIEIKKPKVLGGKSIPFNSFSQITFLNKKTDKIKDKKVINLTNITKETENDAKNFDAGVGLKQLADILRKAYHLRVKLIYAKNNDEKSVAKFRKIIKKVVLDDERYLVSNFNGNLLGLKTGGHISPIAAYDEVSDSVLVLDVAGHKNGWYWAKVIDLYSAMHSKDGYNYRGYLVISK
jgi:hypothetical protein